jgi:hypothetical protein
MRGTDAKPGRHFAVARLAAAALLAAAPQAVLGHGFGQRYDLPVPLWLYLTGAGAAVGVSFLLLAIFASERRERRGYFRLNLLRWRVARAISHRYVRRLVRAIALALFVIVVSAGLIGVQSPFRNIAPIAVWAIWWVGVPYVSVLLGNVWALLNPIDTIFAGVEKALARLTRRSVVSPTLRYPAWLGIWPAVLLFLVFAWAELVWEHNDVPANVAAATLAYCAIAWTGMLLFGRETWLARGEAFSIVFGLLARFSPTEVRVLDAKVCVACPVGNCRSASGCVDCYACFRRARPGAREWNLRPYAVGLLTDDPVHVSTMVLVIVMLATVTFDGFIETPLWAGIVVHASEWIAVDTPSGLSDAARDVLYTLALVGFAAIFLGIYLGFCAAIARLVARSPTAVRASPAYGAGTIARFFVLTLLPIAIAYHMAHYLSFLLMAGQYMIPLASDPFGFGWDLFGTSRYFIRIAIVDARFVWYASIIAIVAGHVAAVYLAHAMAVRVFKDRRTAMLSQYPMLALMIGYTMVSLWIIAQPIVSSRFG